MNILDIFDQVSLIREPGNPSSTSAATMPLIIVLPNGIIYQTTSIRGAVSTIVGSEYLDAADANMEWHYRLVAARKQAMLALEKGRVAVVYDPNQGIVPNNFAADPNDPDYEIEEDEGEQENIYIQNDRLFLLSLIKLDAIFVYERADSYQLREHENWTKLKKGELKQSCSWCIHAHNQLEDENLICATYNLDICEDDGAKCCSFAFSDGPSELIHPGGTYLSVSLCATNVDKLYDSVGQSWIVPDVKF